MAPVFRTPVRNVPASERNEVPLGALDGNQQASAAPKQVKPKVPLDVKGRKEERKKKTKPSALCLTPPSVILGNGNSYQRGSCIGEGGFARCFQVNDGNGEIYAAKTLAKAALTNDKTRSKLITEIKIHRAMKHPNIVRYVDCFEDDKNVYVLLELCSNQSLADMIHHRRNITETEARYFFVQILGAVSYMHCRGIVHRDLKLGNIFLDKDMNLKVGDFGLAAKIDSKTPRRYTICGTPNYISPEILVRPHAHGFASDMWALGIILYAMLVGRPPFQDRNVDQIYESIKHHASCFPDPPLHALAGAHHNVSTEARDLITCLLDPNPDKRPTIEQCLTHEWLTQGSFISGIPQGARLKTAIFHATPQESVLNLRDALKFSGLDKLRHPSVYDNVEGVNSDDIKDCNTSHVLPPSISPPSTKDKYKPVVVADPSSSEKKRVPEYDSPVVGQKYRDANNHNAESPVPARAGTGNYAGGGFEGHNRRRAVSQQTNERNRLLWDNGSMASGPSTHSMARQVSQQGAAPMATRTSTIEPNPLGQSYTRATSSAVPRDPSRPQRPVSSGSRNVLGPLTESMRKTLNNLRVAMATDPSDLDPTIMYTKHTEQPTVVTRWADFEENWGVSYCLNDGSVSILFRDKTSMRMDPVYMTYVYYESVSRPGLVTHHRVPNDTSDPKRAKKMDVLNYVKRYMDSELGHAIEPIRKGGDASHGVIVNTLQKNRDYIMFTLTDGTLQFNFKDHFKLILYDNGTKLGLVTDQHMFFAWNLHGAIRACSQSQFQRVHLLGKLKIMHSAVREFFVRL